MLIVEFTQWHHHLIQISKTMTIDHFPQDQSSKIHKILPITAALEKRNNALRSCVKKPFESKQVSKRNSVIKNNCFNATTN